MWKPVIEAQEKGVVVSVTNDEITSVVGRVGYARWHSRFRWRTFKTQFRVVVARAEAEAERLNE